jgi:hypothetical protein
MSDLLPLLACLPFAALLIHVTPALDGEATRRINKIEEDAEEAAAWLRMMGARK